MRKDDEKQPVTLETLTQHLEEVKKLQPGSKPRVQPVGHAARAAIDFASASAVGIVLGYALDAWQGTSPFGLLAGLFIGTAAGVKLIFEEDRRQRRRSESEKTN